MSDQQEHIEFDPHYLPDGYEVEPVSAARFTVTLPGPHAEEWTAKALQQDIMEAYGLTEQEVKVEKA